jgi:DNA-binding transcriptional regulator YdaS (Cro superfamily)
MRVRGGGDALRELVEIENVQMLEVNALTHKVGQIHTTKQITREGEESEEFMEDLVEFMKNSGASATEPLFSRWAKLPRRKIAFKVCRARMVTEAIKDEVVCQGLSPALFSFHSLRKGTVTHMKAMRMSREETQARGNYSKGSKMIDTVYNYDSSGVGPLAAMARKGGKEPMREDIQRALPIAYK